MTNKEAIEKYKEYLEGHIGNVNEALGVLSTLGITFIDDNIEKLKDIVKDHDKSKYDEPEWTAYLHHFYPTSDEEAMMSEEFETACRHHIKNNKHHWDYWVDDKNNLIDGIDEEEYKLYTVERCCDWLAMANQHEEEPSAWYKANKEFMVMPDYGFELADQIFNAVPEDIKLSYNGTRGDNDGNEETLKEWTYRDTEGSLGDGTSFELDYFNRVKRAVEDKFPDIESTIVNPVDTQPESRRARFIYNGKTIYEIPFELMDIDKILRKLSIIRYQMKEDLYMNRDVVASLGKRVKKSKTSNTIEIDTSMTNHDRQLDENLSLEDKRETLHNLVKEADSEGISKIVSSLCDLGYYANDRRRNGTAFIHNVINNIYGESEKVNSDIEIAICNALRKDREEYLTEITAAQIKQKSKNQDPERINRSRKVKSTYLGMSKFGILNFKTSSQFRNGYHYQTVEFKNMGYFEDIIKSGKKIMPDDVKKAIKEQDINVWCTDESFTYWAWGHLAYLDDFLYIDDRIPDLKKRIQAPTVNNVALNGGSCKHILSVLDYMSRPFTLLAIADDMNEYLSGSQQDRMSKQDDTTKAQTDQIAEWDWDDIEKYTGLDRIQIYADIAKATKVAPMVDKGEVLADIFDEAIPSESQGLRRQIVDRAEELIDGKGE